MASAEDAKADVPSGQAVTKSLPKFIKVENLSPASVGFNLIVKVGKIQPIMNRLNLDGSRLRISEALIGDSTASIILSLRNGNSSYFYILYFIFVRNCAFTHNL